MKFSVITVNYNNCEGLRRTLDSVLMQTCTDYEYIVIDGGSNDGSVDVIKKHSESIDYWVSEPDKGIYNAMNKGIRISKGDYLIFMNSGDCFYKKDVLNSVFKAVKNQPDFVAGGHISKGHIVPPPPVITAMYMFRTTLCHQAVFINRSMFIEEQYKEEYTLVADWVHLFNSLIFKNATYLPINTIISETEQNGVSMTNWKRLQEERVRYLKSMFPERVYKDFKIFNYAKALEGSTHNIFETLEKHSFVRNELQFTNFLLKAFVRLKEILH